MMVLQVDADVQRLIDLLMVDGTFDDPEQVVREALTRMYDETRLEYIRAEVRRAADSKDLIRLTDEMLDELEQGFMPEIGLQGRSSE